MLNDVRKLTCVSTLLVICLSCFTVHAQTSAPVSRNIDAAKITAAPSRGPATATPESSTRVALVIGNSAYENVNKLPNAGNDARDICSALRRLNFTATCLYNLATRRDFRNAVQTFLSQVNRTHTVVIYYAGHGAQILSENFLLPTTIAPRSTADIEEDGVRLGYLLRELENRRSGPNVVILDTCSEKLSSVAIPGIGEGLARAEPPDDTFLVYASAPNKLALDNAGSNGLFTKHLLAHIEEPGIALGDLFDIVGEAVEKEARQRKFEQVPFRNSALHAKYCLAGCNDPSDLAEKLRQKDEQLAKIEAAAAKSEAEASELRKGMAERDAIDKAKNAKLEAEIGVLQTKIADRDKNIANLDSRIDQVTRDSGTTGMHKSNMEAELAGLRSELDAARQERQREAARLEKQNGLLDKELAERRAREADAQRLLEEVERYRRQVADLKREKVELQRAKAPDQRRVIVPNF